MVFVFGIDIPLIELMLVTIAFLVLVLFLIVVNLLWINRKEYQIIKEAGDIIETEHKYHGVRHPSVVKHAVKAAPKEGMFSKFFKNWNAFWEKQKKESEQKWLERQASEQQKAIWKKGPSFFERWNRYWTAQKEQAEKMELERQKAVEERRAAEEKKKAAERLRKLQEAEARKAEIEAKPKETWWEKHKKEVSRKKESPSIFRMWNDYWNKQKSVAEKGWQEEYNVETKEALNLTEPKLPVPPKPGNIESWWEKHKKEVEKRNAILKKQKEKEERIRKIKEAIKNKRIEEEKRRNKLNKWWERHKREIARRKDAGPSFFESWNKYWDGQKKLAGQWRKK